MCVNHNLFPGFQPIISVANGRIVGYEALARTIDSEQNIISAGNLFSAKHLAPEQLREIDRHLRWQALTQFASQQKQSYLALNISAAWIDYVSDVKKLPTLTMLEQLHIDRSRVIIEISEAEADIDKLKEVAKFYRRSGLMVAVDDFGAGFSQLERVMAINPDVIKIDMRLFKKAAKGGIAREAVELLTRFGKRLGSQVICVGVETDDEFIFGLNNGAQFMQGFLFAGAESQFKDPEQYHHHIASLRRKFLQRKIHSEQRKIERSQAVHELMHKLKLVLQEDFNLNALVTWNFERYGVLRFYLCNAEGEQISPDFNFINGKWVNDPKHIGFNWSCRPYFYQILALGNCGDYDQVVTSERYKDFETGTLCKTQSLSLDSERILMVDIVADWD